MKNNFWEKYNKPIALSAMVVTILLFVYFVYAKLLPTIVESQWFLSLVQNYIKQSCGAELVVENPHLDTSTIFKTKFSADNIQLAKNKANCFVAKNLFVEISLARVLGRKIALRWVSVDYLFADTDKLNSLFPKNDKKNKKPFWKISWFRSYLYVKECEIKSTLNQNVKTDVIGKNILVTKEKNTKYAHFDISAVVMHGSEKTRIHFKDNNSVYIKDKVLYIKNGIIKMNASKLKIDGYVDEKNNYSVDFSSKNFELKNVFDVINSNLVVSNGKEILNSFANVSGLFDFNINLKQSGLSGKININKAFLKIVPLQNLPVTLNKGLITIMPSEIKLSDYEGFYGNNSNNKITAYGTISDYMKVAKSDIMVIGNATNELTEQYISKLVGTKLNLTGDSKTVFRVLTDGNDINLKWMFKLAKGNDILIDGMSITPPSYDRVLLADMNLNGNIFKIKSIDYYIASVIDKNSTDIKPILTLDGNLDLAKNGEVIDLGFKIPKPLPSEFLNVLIGQKLFKKGTISGQLKMINSNNIPKLLGDVEMNKVLVPSQRLSIRKAKLSAKDSLINVSAEGRFKRSDYNYTGKVENHLTFPIVVKNSVLTVDNIDVERVLTSFNNQNTDAVKQNIEDNVEDIEDENYFFDTSLLVIENSSLNITKGNYKDLKFGNINSTMTLDKDGIFKIHSNRFDFADGISTLRGVFDLKKHDYNLRLGVRNVDSNLISSVLLSLPNEISGKADGLIVINTDESMKLNGEINFSITDGTIEKIGLVEYLLRLTSFFRNPLAMVSPSTMVNMVNIPKGVFDSITGELSMKDNVIKKIMIKSIAPQLSTVIIGKYDIEKNDAALRIYTKFSNKTKGFSGIFNNISLNGLANVIPLGNNNAKNYYEAELKILPPIDADEKDCQVFLTTIDGDLTNNNFISSLKKIE